MENTDRLLMLNNRSVFFMRPSFVDDLSCFYVSLFKAIRANMNVLTAIIGNIRAKSVVTSKIRFVAI